MYKIKKIRFNNFGRFVKEQTLELDTLPKITQIDGKNLNTGGSSGAAKTTLLRTLDYVLGINEVPATILQSRLTKDAMYVEAEGEWDGAPVTIYRSKGDLRVSGVDPKTSESFSITGSSELAEEKIDEILGLPRDLFKKITHKEQGEGGFFLNMTPKNAFEFMLKTLNLGSWLDKMERAEADASLVRPRLPKAEAEKGLASREHAAAVAAFETLGLSPEPEAPDLTGKAEKEALAASLRHEVAEIDKKRSAIISILDKKMPLRPELPDDSPETIEMRKLLNSMTAEIKKVEAEKADKISKFRASLQALSQAHAAKSKGLKDTEAQLARLEGERASLKALIAERASVEREMEAHKDSRCPTCSQHWPGAGLSPHAKMLKLKLEGILKAERRLSENEMETGVTASSIACMKQEIPALSDKIEKATSILNKLTDEDTLARARSEAEELQRRLNEASEAVSAQMKALMADYHAKVGAHLAKKREVEQDLAERRRAAADRLAATEAALRELHGKQTVYEHLLQRRRDAIEAAEKTADRWSAAAKKADDEYEALKGELALYEDARRAIKAFCMTQFEGALVRIGERATQTVNTIPNMATATITFEPFKEVKGKIKDEIVALIGMDGEESVPLKSLSGGEKNVADNAIDLAVVDLIEETSGIGSNYYILDEPCNGQDSVCKTEFMEMLKSSTTNKRVFIVEHDPIIKQGAEHSIVVERNGVTSRVL